MTEPDSVILRLLGEIRGILDDHSRLHEEHRKAFARLDMRMDEWQETTATAVGLAVHGNVRREALDKRFDALLNRVERLERRP